MAADKQNVKIDPKVWRKIEAFVATLRLYDPDAAVDFDARIDEFWFDGEYLPVVLDELREALVDAIARHDRDARERKAAAAR